MQYSTFTALPEFLSKVAKSLLFASNLDEATGRLSWPRIVMYEYVDAKGLKIRAPIPPANEINFTVSIANQEAYDYLYKTGWIYDSRHTGREYKVVDNRPAPGA